MTDAAPCSRAPRRRPLAALAAALTWCAVVAGTVLVPAVPAAAVACPAPPAGHVAVAVVVDDGSSAPVQRCVVIREKRTGMDALIAAYPMRESGGFVCAIDGLPEAGCARDDASLPYWRYWHTDGSAWSYASTGAGFHRLLAPADGSRCLVEGWSYGRSTSGAPSNAPRVAPAAVRCDFPAPAPTPTAPPSSAPAAVPGGASPGSSSTGSGAAPSPGAGSSQQVAPPNAPAEPGPGADAPGSDPDGESGAPDEPGTDDAAGDHPVDGADRSDDPDPASDDAGSDDGAEVLAATARSGSGSGPSWVGTALVGLLVAALGGAAVLQRRSRRNA